MSHARIALKVNTFALGERGVRRKLPPSKRALLAEEVRLRTGGDDQVVAVLVSNARVRPACRVYLPSQPHRQVRLSFQ